MNNVAPKVKSIVEKACLVVVLLVVLALSSVPVIIYFVNVSLAMQTHAGLIIIRQVLIFKIRIKMAKKERNKVYRVEIKQVRMWVHESTGTYILITHSYIFTVVITHLYTDYHTLINVQYMFLYAFSHIFTCFPTLSWFKLQYVSETLISITESTQNSGN